MTGTAALADDRSKAVSDEVIGAQRAALASATDGAGFGPQAPRDIDSATGNNRRVFGASSSFARMNLCNIHFHESAEHKGGEFTTYAGNGDGHGYGTGFKYDGDLSEAELAPIDMSVGGSKYGGLEPGDTIEIHFVYSSAEVSPGPALDACMSAAVKKPDLRVEAVIAVLVSNGGANFTEMTDVEIADGLYQAVNLPSDLGKPVVYAGSTTGPDYNEEGSPYQVTWSVRPQVAKLDIASVDTWLKNNLFEEKHAHAVRNLIIDPDLLAPIMR
ncbi:hypothetical protein JHX88_17845 [Paracoccus saliphilus]|nr:hypothetical protein JHX88_17845 [Paracoccus saliphilus]